jgi:hypothetical protein
MNREVTRPVLLRPPVRFLDSTSAFSGRCLVISSRVVIVWKRRVGVVGLYVLIGMFVALSHQLSAISYRRQRYSLKADR